MHVLRKRKALSRREKTAGNPGNMTPSRNTIWHLIFAAKSTMALSQEKVEWPCNHAGKFDFIKKHTVAFGKQTLWKKITMCRIYFRVFPIEKGLIFRRWYRWGLVGTCQVPEHFEDEVELGGFFGCEFLVGKWNSGKDDINITTKNMLSLLFYFCVCLITFW